MKDIPLITDAEVDAINSIAMDFLANSTAHGFWEGLDDKDPLVLMSKIALIHSEASEALEELRKPGLSPSTVYLEGEKLCGFGSELADIIIRTLELASKLNIDLGRIIAQKHAHNVSRPYKHGKTA